MRFSSPCISIIRIGMVVLGLTANVSLGEQHSAGKDQQEPGLAAVPGVELRLPPDFKAELLYTVPRQQGSWVSITDDPQGRLIVSDQYGRLYRVDTRTELAVEPIEMEIGSAQGLLCAFDSLYAVCHGNNDRPSGLYRLTDTNADDKYDSVQLLRKFDGSGEHGPHAVILGPDKRSLYVCAGNHTDLPQLERSRVPRLWQEDQVIPRLPDAGGHAVGRMAPGGWICKTDPDAKQFELMSSGIATSTILHLIAMASCSPMTPIWNGISDYRGIVRLGFAMQPVEANSAGETVRANGPTIVPTVCPRRSKSAQAARPVSPLVPAPSFL